MMVSPVVSVSAWAIGLHFLVLVHGGDNIEERVCGTLYSEANFQGDSFKLNDFDFSVDTSKDYRRSLSGWMNTGSAQVNEKCSMYLCSEKYFQGTCNLVLENLTETALFISQVRSANCTCPRECSCNDVILPNNRFGRSYLKGGCQLCDTEYWDMNSGSFLDYNRYSQKIQTFKIRRGCNLTLYSDPGKVNVLREYSNEIIENNFEIFGSYQVSCNDSLYIPPPPKPQSISDPPKITLPKTSQDMLKMVSTNEGLAKHPGIQAALKSLQSGRSWKHAYILVIGRSEVEVFLHAHGCMTAEDKSISECRTAVSIDSLGVSDSEIRIIYYQPVSEINDDDAADYVIMASIDDYLSNHEELKYVIPNAVVIFQDISNKNNPSKQFLVLQRQLRILNALRGRILDESYSNVIFYLDLGKITDVGNVEARISNFEKNINSQGRFPKPTFVIPNDFVYFFSNDWKLINGYKPNGLGEYWPLNVLQTLRVICERSNDLLGKAIFTRMMIETGIDRKVSLIESDLLHKTHRLVDYYKRCSTENSSGVCANAIQRPHPELSITGNSVETYKLFPVVAGLLAKISDLEKSLKLSELSTSSLTNRVQQLEEELVRQKDSRDADNEKIAGEILDDVKRQLNILYGN